MLQATPVHVLLPHRVQDDLPPWGQPVYQLDGPTMGTSWRLNFHGPQGLDVARVRAAVQAELQDTVAQMSHWEPDSVLSRFNRAAAGSRWCLPRAFAEVMGAALSVAQASGGAFDPCLGGLVSAWGFGPPGAISPGRLAAGTHSPVWQGLAWDATQGAITQPGDAVLDLSAIAKGHAVDRLSKLLHGIGLPHHLVEVGGELRGAGLKSSGQPWWVDVELPSADCRLPRQRIALHGLAVATSGDYRRYVTDADGRRRAHTMDPRVGAPAEHGLALVSVLHDSAMWADAWSTALMALGPQQGLALADQQGLAAWLVQRLPDGRFEGQASAAWRAMS